MGDVSCIELPAAALQRGGAQHYKQNRHLMLPMTGWAPGPDQYRPTVRCSVWPSSLQGGSAECKLSSHALQTMDVVLRELTLPRPHRHQPALETRLTLVAAAACRPAEAPASDGTSQVGLTSSALHGPSCFVMTGPFSEQGIEHGLSECLPAAALQAAWMLTPPPHLIANSS